MSRGFISGKVGPIAPGHRMGQAIPIVPAVSTNGCPPGYTPNALGVCMLGPSIVGGGTTIYTSPFILGRKR